MRKILKIAGNELRALFCSPVAWFILVIFAVQSGMTFTDLFRSVLRQQFMGEPIEYSITTALLTGMSGTFTVIQQYLYLYVPLLTMGLMSREFGSGSIKLLYSSPVTAGQIIWGKFLSMMVYGLILMGVLLVLVLFACCTVESFDLSAALSGLLGLYLLMCAYAAIGLYMSSLTSYQVVAAVGTLAVLIVLNFIGSVGQDIAFVREITYWLSIKGRATVFIDGLICSEDFLYFVVVILFFLTLGIMKIEAHRAKRSQVMTVGRYLVVIAVTVALGYMTSRPTFLWYYDATASKTQTLTKESQSILERMKDDLTIVTYVNLLGDNSFYGMPRSLKSDMENFKPYIRFKSNIELKYVYYYKKVSSYIRERYADVSDREVAEKYVDQMKLNLKMFLSPEEIEAQIDLAPEGYRFVRQLVLPDGSATFLRLYNDMFVHPMEAEVSAALKRLIMEVPKVACLTGHGERDMNNVGDRDYYAFAKNPTFRYALVNNGFDVIAYRMTEGEEIPEDIRILVIADVKQPLTESELEKIDRYVARGGNLLIAGEPGRQEVMNPLVERFGVQFMPGVLVQPSRDFDPDLIRGELTKDAAEMSLNYADLQKKKRVITMPGATALNYTMDKGFMVRPVLTTHDTGCWNEIETRDLLNEPVELNPVAGEKEGVYPIALALSRKMGNREQRIIVLGDADCISNSELMMYRKGIKASNFSLITESFRWLTDGEFPVNTRRPDPADTSISLELSSMKWVKLMFVGILPLLLIGCGILIWHRRRGR